MNKFEAEIEFYEQKFKESKTKYYSFLRDNKVYMSFSFQLRNFNS